MNYVSQVGQDKILDRLLSFKRFGFFVDIGANDGYTGSNSLFFEQERGYKGICVEPFRNHKLYTRKCQIIYKAVSSDNKDRTLFISSISHVLNHLKNDDHQRHYPGIERTIGVPCCTLEDIVQDKEIDFVSIDVEGHEPEIFRVYEPKGNVKIFCIENVYNKTLKIKGYYRLTRTLFDDIYVKRIPLTYWGLYYLFHGFVFKFVQRATRIKKRYFPKAWL